MLKKLEKFPVVSKGGIEYLAKIETYNNIMNDKVLRVRLYVKDKYKLFWMEKERFTEVKEGYYDNEGSHKYVDAIKQTVEDFEIEIKEKADKRRDAQKAREVGLKHFEEWDGVCR